MTERDLQSAILQAAGYLGWRCYHAWSSLHSARGFPDAVCVRNGACLMLEFKSTRGRVTVAQQAWLDDLDAVPGITARVVRPADWLSGAVDRLLLDEADP